MNEETTTSHEIVEDKPDSFWFRVYFIVFIYTVLIISVLALFSWYFSK